MRKHVCSLGGSEICSLQYIGYAGKGNRHHQHSRETATLLPPRVQSVRGVKLEKFELLNTGAVSDAPNRDTSTEPGTDE